MKLALAICVALISISDAAPARHGDGDFLAQKLCDFLGKGAFGEFYCISPLTYTICGDSYAEVLRRVPRDSVCIPDEWGDDIWYGKVSDPRHVYEREGFNDGDDILLGCWLGAAT